jgi:nitrate/nitrite transport system substrate-binding protein
MSNETGTPAPPDPTRRDFVRRSGLAAATALVAGGAPREGAWAAGTDAPEKSELKVGFIPLTDCASLVVAATQGFDRKYGIRITLSREQSWAAVRDKLLSGELDAAHMLYGLVYGVQLGIGGLRRDMAVLMTLNRNGQAITLSNHLRGRGVSDGASLKALLEREQGDYIFAQTFPTGTHAMWLYYWLASHGIHPLSDVNTVTIPPPRMVTNLRGGRIDGCCVGEPWNARAVHDGVGFTVATSQDVWPDHPEKVLATTGELAQRHPNASRALIMALLEASRFVDTMANRPKVAQLLAEAAYVGTDAAVIEQRFLGAYDDGLGRRWRDRHPLAFHQDGEVNFPYLSDGMWFMTQHRRWGLLKEDADYLGVATKVNQVTLYTEAAAQAKVPVPRAQLRSSTLMDGTVWDGHQPHQYAGGFRLCA